MKVRKSRFQMTRTEQESVEWPIVLAKPKRFPMEMLQQIGSNAGWPHKQADEEPD